MIVRSTSNVTTSSSTTLQMKEEERTLDKMERDNDDISVPVSNTPNMSPRSERSEVSPASSSTRKDDDSAKKQQQQQHKGPKRLLTGRPKRARSAYNYFFRSERAKLMGVTEEELDEEESNKNFKRKHRKTPGMIGFANLASVVGQKWKDLPMEEKEPFELKARQDKERFDNELAQWKEKQQKKKLQEQQSRSSNKYHDVPAPGGPYAFCGHSHEACDKEDLFRNNGLPRRVLSSAFIWESRNETEAGPAARNMEAPAYTGVYQSRQNGWMPGQPARVIAPVASNGPSHAYHHDPRYYHRPYPTGPPQPHQYTYPPPPHHRTSWEHNHQGSWEEGSSNVPIQYVAVPTEYNVIKSCDSTCSSISAHTHSRPPTASASSAPASPFRPVIQTQRSETIPPHYHPHPHPGAAMSGASELQEGEGHRPYYHHYTLPPPAKRSRYDTTGTDVRLIGQGHVPSFQGREIPAGQQHQQPHCYRYHYPREHHAYQHESSAPRPCEMTDRDNQANDDAAAGPPPRKESRQGSFTLSEAAVASSSGLMTVSQSSSTTTVNHNNCSTTASAHEEEKSHMTKWKEVIVRQRQSKKDLNEIRDVPDLRHDEQVKPLLNDGLLPQDQQQRLSNVDEENREFVTNTLLDKTGSNNDDREEIPSDTGRSTSPMFLEEHEELFRPISVLSPNYEESIPPMMLSLLNPPSSDNNVHNKVLLTSDNKKNDTVASRDVANATNISAAVGAAVEEALFNGPSARGERTSTSATTYQIKQGPDVSSSVHNSVVPNTIPRCVTKCMSSEGDALLKSQARHRPSKSAFYHDDDDADAPFMMSLKTCGSTDSTDTHAREDMLQFLSLIID